MPRTNFRPQIDGFRFINNWTFDQTERQDMARVFTVSVNEALMLLAGPFGAFLGVLGVGSALAQWLTGVVPNFYGLCGGMAFAALDYYRVGLVVPRGNSLNDQPRRPDDGGLPEGAMLRAYLWQRLLDSLNGNAATFLAWMAVLHLVPKEWPFLGGPPWLHDKSLEQWDALKQHVDAGEPWPIGLIGTTTNPFFNHQVLAYGYEDSGDGTELIYIYDMNGPDREQTIRLDFNAHDASGSPILMATESNPSSERGPLRAFFCENYSSFTPPIAMHGNTLQSGEEGTPLRIGDPYDFVIRASNVGFCDSSPLRLFVLDRSEETGEATELAGETALSVISRGQSRDAELRGRLRGPVGRHHAFVACDLGTFDDVHIQRTLPVDLNGHEDSVDIWVNRERRAIISIDTLNYDFGQVSPWDQAEFVFKVTNAGELPLTIASVSNPNDGVFTRVLSYWRQGEPVLPLIIAPPDQWASGVPQILQVKVQFAPQDTAEHAAHIRITSNDYFTPSRVLNVHGGLHVLPPRCAEIDRELEALTASLGDPELTPQECLQIERQIRNLNVERNRLGCQ